VDADDLKQLKREVGGETGVYDEVGLGDGGSNGGVVVVEGDLDDLEGRGTKEEKLGHVKVRADNTGDIPALDDEGPDNVVAEETTSTEDEGTRHF